VSGLQRQKFWSDRWPLNRKHAPNLFISHFCLLLFSFKRNRQRASSSSDTPSYSVPSTWSPIDPSEEFKVVELSKILHHDEYSKAKEQFLTTMKGCTVKSVKRVQNPGLWEDYERYMYCMLLVFVVIVLLQL
jgi:hypothetical protein